MERKKMKKKERKGLKKEDKKIKRKERKEKVRRKRKKIKRKERRGYLLGCMIGIATEMGSDSEISYSIEIGCFHPIGFKIFVF